MEMSFKLLYAPSLSRSSAVRGSFSNPSMTWRNIALETRDIVFDGTIPV